MTRKFESPRMTRGLGFVIGVLVLAGLILLSALLSVYTIPAGSVGVVTRWQAVDRVVQPGIGFKWPIAEAIVQMDVRTQKDQVDSTAASKDLQQVTSTILFP